MRLLPAAMYLESDLHCWIQTAGLRRVALISAQRAVAHVAAWSSITKPYVCFSVINPDYSASPWFCLIGWRQRVEMRRCRCFCFCWRGRWPHHSLCLKPLSPPMYTCAVGRTPTLATFNKPQKNPNTGELLLCAVWVRHLPEQTTQTKQNWTSEKDASLTLTKTKLPSSKEPRWLCSAISSKDI